MKPKQNPPEIRNKLIEEIEKRIDKMQRFRLDGAMSEHEGIDTNDSRIKEMKVLRIATKKLTRKKWTKKLDDLARAVCYARDKNRSVKSGTTQNLNMAHVYPKGRYPRLRWELDNLLTLAWNEHLLWAHRSPIEFTHWFEEKYPERAKRLKKMSQYIDRSPIDYEAIKLYLENELKI